MKKARHSAPPIGNIGTSLKVHKGMNNRAQTPLDEAPEAKLERLFRESVAQLNALGDPRVEASFREILLDAGGSWLRPKLVFAVAEGQTPAHPHQVTVAAVAEMVHCASLLHDDVVDEGFTRRGQPTANAKYGNGAAVLCGDVLMANALQLFGEAPPGSHWASGTHHSRTFAQRFGGTGFRYRGHARPADWASIAERKTGSLLGFCLAGLRRAARRSLFRIGYTLGRFFQLCDDLKDFQISGTGKPALQDLKNGNINWLLLHASERNPLFRKALHQLWRSSPAAHECVAFFESWDFDASFQAGFEHARTLKAAFAVQSARLLNKKAHRAVEAWLETVIEKALRSEEKAPENLKVSLQSA